MYGCESWTVKKAEHQRIDAFELWCWRRLLRVPWTTRKSNQSILKEISPGCSLEGLMLKLKLQYFCHLMWRVDSLEKTLMLGGIWGRRRKTGYWSGIAARSQHGRSHPWQGHAEETCSSIYPQTRIHLFYYFMPFTNSSDINRGLSLTTFLWRKSS